MLKYFLVYYINKDYLAIPSHTNPFAEQIATVSVFLSEGISLPEI